MENIQKFWEQQFPQNVCTSIEKMQGGGSDRQYFRIHTEDSSYVVVFNKDIAENLDFIHLTHLLEDAGTSVAKILAVSEDIDIYALQDLGDLTLLSVAMDPSIKTDDLLSLYKKTIDQLHTTQIALHTLATDLPEYGYELVLHDLMYFLYDFVKVAGIDFDPSVTLHGLTEWAEKHSHFNVQGFMYRDFQGRNVMILDKLPYLIDYQGGMYGPTAYDMSSLLYQAKAQLSTSLRQELWQYYKTKLIADNTSLTEEALDEDYQFSTLLRLLQVLGAYGYRGIVQGKEHFISSIEPALINLKEFIQEQDLYIPEGLLQVLYQITEDDFIQKFKK